MSEEKRDQWGIWEQIETGLYRTPIFGGWLVKALEDVVHLVETQGRIPGWDWRVALTFVPDPAHEWVLGTDKTREVEK